MGTLIDTSVLIATERTERFTDWCRQQLKMLSASTYVSPMVLSELRVGVVMATQSDLAVARQKTLTRALSLECLPITQDTALLHAQISTEVKLAGKVRVRTHDLWLAATAIEHDLTLLTCNSRDFADIRGLKFIAP